MSSRSVNLNLVPVLRALLKTKSVSKAAERLNLSQPATSAALARLREILGDPLLIRAGRGMQLTSHAQRLVDRLERVCDELDSLLEVDTFDPARAVRRFLIAAPDYLVFLLGSPLIRRLSAQAPNVQIQFVDITPNLPDLLINCQIDIAACAVFDGLWPELKRGETFPDRIVGVVAKGHPLLARQTITPADLDPYFKLSPGGGPGSTPAWQAATEGLPGMFEKPQVLAQQFMPLPFIVAESTAIARLPKSLADRLIKVLPLDTFELPGDNRILKGVVWSSVQEPDLGHQWLRGVLTELIAETLGRCAGG